jgi:hypothetical protein
MPDFDCYLRIYAETQRGDTRLASKLGKLRTTTGWSGGTLLAKGHGAEGLVPRLDAPANFLEGFSSGTYIRIWHSSDLTRRPT